MKICLEKIPCGFFVLFALSVVFSWSAENTLTQTAGGDPASSCEVLSFDSSFIVGEESAQNVVACLGIPAGWDLTNMVVGGVTNFTPMPAGPNVPMGSFATNGPADDCLVISELYWDPATGDFDQQYIELFNGTAGPVDLCAYDIADVAPGAADTFNIACPFMIQPGETILIVPAGNPAGYAAPADGDHIVEVNAGPLGNGLFVLGDGIVLNKNGAEIDRVEYQFGQCAAGESLIRSPAAPGVDPVCLPQSPGTVCRGGGLQPGDEITMSFDVIVPCGADAGQITLEWKYDQVSCDGTESVVTAATVSLPTNIFIATVQTVLDLTIGPDDACGALGDTVTLELELCNIGDGLGSHAAVSGNLGPGLEIAGMPGVTNFFFDETTVPGLASLAVGACVTIPLDVTYVACARHRVRANFEWGCSAGNACFTNMPPIRTEIDFELRFPDVTGYIMEGGDTPGNPLILDVTACPAAPIPATLCLNNRLYDPADPKGQRSGIATNYVLTVSPNGFFTICDPATGMPFPNGEIPVGDLMPDGQDVCVPVLIKYENPGCAATPAFPVAQFFTSSYQDECGNPFLPPTLFTYIQVQGEPPPLGLGCPSAGLNMFINEVGPGDDFTTVDPINSSICDPHCVEFQIVVSYTNMNPGVSFDVFEQMPVFGAPALGLGYAPGPVSVDVNGVAGAPVPTMPGGAFTGDTFSYTATGLTGDGTITFSWEMCRAACDCAAPGPANGVNKCNPPTPDCDMCAPCCFDASTPIENQVLYIDWQRPVTITNCQGCAVECEISNVVADVESFNNIERNPDCNMDDPCCAGYIPCIPAITAVTEVIDPLKICQPLCFTSEFEVGQCCAGITSAIWDNVFLDIDTGGLDFDESSFLILIDGVDETLNPLIVTTHVGGAINVDFSAIPPTPGTRTVKIEFCSFTRAVGFYNFQWTQTKPECDADVYNIFVPVEELPVEMDLFPLFVVEPCQVTTARFAITLPEECELDDVKIRMNLGADAGGGAADQVFFLEGGVGDITLVNGPTPTTTAYDGTNVIFCYDTFFAAAGDALEIEVPVRATCSLNPSAQVIELVYPGCGGLVTNLSNVNLFDPTLTDPPLFRPEIVFFPEAERVQMCSTTAYYRMTVLNAGSGNAYDIQPKVSYDPAFWCFATNIFATSMFTQPMAMPLSTTNIGGNTECIIMNHTVPGTFASGPPGLLYDFTGLADVDGDGFYDDLPPGESISYLVPLNLKACGPSPVTNIVATGCGGAEQCEFPPSNVINFELLEPALITQAELPDGATLCSTNEICLRVRNLRCGSAYNFEMVAGLPEFFNYVPGSATVTGTNGTVIAAINDPVQTAGANGYTMLTFTTNTFDEFLVIDGNGRLGPQDGSNSLLICFETYSPCEAQVKYGTGLTDPFTIDSNHEDFCGNPVINNSAESSLAMLSPDLVVRKFPDGRVVDIQTVNSYTIEIGHTGQSRGGAPFIHLCDQLPPISEFCVTDIEGIGPIGDPNVDAAGPGVVYFASHPSNGNNPMIVWSNAYLDGDADFNDANGDGSFDIGEGPIRVLITGILKTCDDPVNCVDLFYGCNPEMGIPFCDTNEFMCLGPARDCGSYDTSPQPNLTGPAFQLNITPCGGEKCITWTNIGATMTNITFTDEPPAGFVYDPAAMVNFSGEWSGMVPVGTVIQPNGTIILDIDALCNAGVFGTPPAVDTSMNGYGTANGTGANPTGGGPTVQKVELNFMDAIEICIPLIPDPDPDPGFVPPFDCTADPNDLDFSDPLGPTLFFPDMDTEICYYPLCPGAQICNTFANTQPAEFPQPDVDLQPNSFIVTPGGVQNFCVTIQNMAQVSEADNIVSITCLESGWLPVTPGDVTSITPNISFGVPGNPQVTTFTDPAGNTCLKVDLVGTVLGPSDSVEICFDATSSPNPGSTRITTEMTTACGDPVSSVLINNNPCNGYPNTEGDGPYLYNAPGGGGETIYNIDQDRAFGIGLLQDKVVKYPDEPDSAFRTNLNARVGECLVYRLTWQMWGADFNNVVLSDTLPVGWILDAASPINIVSNENSQGVTVPLTFSATGQTIEWNAGNLPQEFYTFVIDVPIKVANVSANNNCDYKFNEATVSFDVEGFDTPLPAVSNKVHVVEGFLNIMKMPDPCDVLEFGESVVYTVTVDMEAMSNTCVYDIVISDALPPSLVMAPFGSDGLDNDGDGSIDEADEASQLSGQAITIDSSHNPQLAMWCPGDPPVVIQYEGELAGVIIPGVEITNTATVVWDSLPDGYPNDSEERDGTDTGPNDYLTNDVKVITSIVEFAMSKSLIGSSEPYTPLDLPTIGERLIYSVRIDLPSAGIMPRLQILDDLPPGLDFVGCDTDPSLTFPGIGYAIVVPPGGPTLVGANAANPLPFDPAIGGGGGNPWPSITDEDPTPCNNVNGDGNGDRVRWRFQSTDVNGVGADYIENVQDNDPSNDYFEIHYEVIVKDIPANFDWETLTNNAQFRWGGDNGNPRDLFEPGETNITDSVDVMITEPKLTLDKSMELMDDMVIITLVVSNDAGGSSAFDITIDDLLPHMCFVPGSAMPVTIPRDYSFITTSPDPANPMADLVQITTNSSQTFQDRELLPGDTITFVFKANITEDDQGPVMNTADIVYSSIDGADPWERTRTTNDSAVLHFASYRVGKSVVSPNMTNMGAQVGIDQVVYEITVENTSTMPTNITIDSIVDTFDPAVLQYVSDTSGATAVPNNSAGTVTWTGFPTTLAQGDTLTFQVTFDTISSTHPAYTTNAIQAEVSAPTGQLPSKGGKALAWTWAKGIAVFKSIADDECLCNGTENPGVFEITVVNTGTVWLTNIMIDDTQYPACDTTFAPPFTLGPGSNVSYLCTTTLNPAFQTNEVVVTASPDWINTPLPGPATCPGLLAGKLPGNASFAPNPGNLGVSFGPDAYWADGGPNDADREAHWQGAGTGPGSSTIVYTGDIYLPPGDTHFLLMSDDQNHLTIDGTALISDTVWNSEDPATFTNPNPTGSWFSIDLRTSNGGGGYGLFGQSGWGGVASGFLMKHTPGNLLDQNDPDWFHPEDIFRYTIPAVDPADLPTDCVTVATNGISFGTDTNKPEFVFRPDPTDSYECIDDVPTATTNWVYVIDDCMNGLTVTVDITTNDATGCPTDPTLVSNVWTATDGCGNVCAYTQVVTVIDTTELKIVAPDDLELDCFPGSGLLAGQLPPPATDLTLFWMQGGKAIYGCSAGIVFEEELVIGDCGLHTVTRTYTLTNECYTDVSDVQTITYYLGNTPVVTCPPDQDLGCLQSTNIFHGMQLAPATVDCPGTLVYTDVVTQAGCIYTVTRTWTARGQCSAGAGDQEMTCDVVYTFTVDEEEPKFVDIPADRDLGCYDGALTEAAITNFIETLAPLAADLAAVVSSDNCNEEQVLFDCNHVTNTACGVQLNRRIKIVDACGNQVVEDIVYTLTINDGTPPDVAALDDVDLECIFAVSQIPPPITTLVDASDPCGVASITHISDTELGTPCAGDLERVYEVVDVCGNSATVNQHFFYVIDTVFPKITNMPPDTFLGCLADDAAAMAAMPSVAADMAQVLASNECNVVTTHMGDSWSTNGCTVSIDRSFMVTDECNNIDVRAVVYTYTVTPAAPPVITGPATLDLGCIQDCAQLPAPNVGQFTATSDCDVGPVVFLGESPVALAAGLCGLSVDRAYAATDECGQVGVFIQTLLFSLDVTPSITAVEAGGDMGCQPCGTHPATNLADLAFADFFDHICNEVPVPGLAYEYWTVGQNTLLQDFFGGGGVTPAAAPNATGVVTANLFNDDAIRTQADRYIIRWTGFINITTPGTYFFDTESDDGSRLYIDGNLIVDNDGFHGRVRRDGQATLSAGCHAVEIQFSEATGGDFVEVRWNGPDSGNTRQFVPDSAFVQNCCVGCVASCAEAAGLTADVWGSNAGANLGNFFGGAGNTPPGLVSTVAVPGLTQGNPSSFDPDGNTDNFTVRWRGFIKVPACGDYTFYTTSDDGSMVYINGDLIVNNDGNHGNQTRQGTVTLEKGCHAIEVQFFESGGGQNIVTEWESADAGIGRQQIPDSVMFTECCPDSPADFTPEELMECGYLSVTDVVSTNDAACQVIIDRTYRIEACCGNFAEASTSFSYTKIPSAEAGVLADLDAGCVPSTNVIPLVEDYLINASSSCEVVSIDFLRAENFIDTQCVDSFDRIYIVETLCGVFDTVTQTVSYVLESEPPRITGIIGFEDFGCVPPGTIPRSVQEELDSIAAIDDVAVTSTNLVRELFSTNDCVVTVARTYRVEDCCGNAHELGTSFSFTPIPDAPVVTTPPADLAVGCISALGQIPPLDLTTVAIDSDCPVLDIRYNGNQNQTDSYCESSFERVYTVETLCDVTVTFTQTVTYCLDTAPPQFVALPAYTNYGCVAADPRTLADELAAIVAADDKTVVRTQLIMEVRSVQDCEILVERTWRVEDCCGKFDTKQSSYAYTLSPTNLLVTAPADQDLGCIPDLGQIPAPNLSGVGVGSPGIAVNSCQTALVAATADAFIRGNTVPSGFGAFANNIVWSEIGVQDTKTYIKFDVSTVPILPSIATPSLKLFVDVVPNVPGISGFPATIDVYGLNDGDAGEGWGENTIDWANAPQNDPAPGAGVLGGATLLDSVPVDVGTNGMVTVSGAALANFVQADTDGSITFILVAGNPTSWEMFVGARESDNPPALCYESCVATPADPDCPNAVVSHEGDTVIATTNCTDYVDRVFRVTDLCGLSVITTQRITYAYNAQAPQIAAVSNFLDYGCVDAEPRPLGASSNAIVVVDDNTALLTTQLVNEVRLTNNCQVTVTRTWRVEDCCGAFGTADETYRYTIRPSGATVAALADLDLGCIPDLGQIPLPNSTLVQAQSDCSIVSITHSEDLPPSTIDACVDSFQRVYLVEDLCGAITPVTQLISYVFDSQNPSFDVVAPFVDYGCVTGEPRPLSVSSNALVASDDHTLLTFSLVNEVRLTNNCQVTVTRSWRVEDCCGKFDLADETYRFTIQPSPATVSVLGPLDLGCINDIGQVPQPNTTLVSAQSACSIVAISHLRDDPSDGGYCTETFGRVYQIEDLCANLLTVTQQISYVLNEMDPMILDTEPPVDFGCQDLTSWSLPLPDAAATNAVVAMDANLVSTQWVGDVHVTNGCDVTVTRTWRVEDCCGKKADATVTFTYVVQPAAAPAVSGPTPVDLGCITSAGLIPLPSTSSLTIQSDCAGWTAAHLEDRPATTDGCVSSFERVYTATDRCGQSSTWTQTITYTEDAQDPVFVSIPADDDFGCQVNDPIPPVITNIIVGADDTLVLSTTLVSQVRSTNNCVVTEVRTWQLADCCGNTTEQTVTYQYTPQSVAGPSITAPAQLDLGCINDASQVAPPAPATATASADCGIASITWLGDSAPVTAGCVTTIIRTYQATDNCNVSNIGTQIITYTTDALPPVFTSLPADEDFGCVSADPVPTDTTLDVAAIDESQIVRLGMVSETRSTNNCNVTVVRTFEAEDCCGRVTSGQTTYTFTWRIAPAVISGNATLALGCIPSIGLIPGPSITPLNASSGCPIQSFDFLQDDAPTTVGCVTSFDRLYQVIDNCGQPTVFTQVVSYTVDLNDPTIDAPAGEDFGCVDTDPLPVPDTNAVTTTDDSVVVRVEMVDEARSTNGCDVTVVRTWEAEDCCGMIVSDTSTYTFTWRLPPALITGQSDIDLGCIPSTASIPMPNITPLTATSGCTIDSFDHLGDAAAVQNGCVWSFERTYEVVDNCGQQSVFVQTYRYVLDAQDPVITSVPDGQDFGCQPAAFTMPAPDAAATGAVVAVDDLITRVEWIGDTYATNVCGVTITRIWEAEDCCNNIVQQTAVSSFTVLDAPPTVDALPVLDLGCINDLGQVPQPNTAAVSAQSGCPLAGIVHSGDTPTSNDPCGSALERVYEVTDNCGQTVAVTQLVTWVIDNENPKVTATQSGGDLGCAPVTIPAVDLSQVTATDNCGVDSIVWHCDITNVLDCVTTITRIYRVTDNCGNQVDSTVLYTYTTDSTPPQIGLPFGFEPAIDLGCNPLFNALPPVDPSQFSVADDCGTVAVIHESDSFGSNGCAGVLTRVYSATDGCNNRSEVVQTINFIVDVERPTPGIVPENLDLGCDPAAVPGPNAAVFGVTGMCSTLAETNVFEETTTSSGCQFTMLRTYELIDECGNRSTADQTITWTESESPTITCPPDVTLPCNALPPSPNPALASATGCGIGAVTHAGDLPGPGMVFRVFEATDNCGNTISCTQTYSFASDGNDPVITSVPQGGDLGCNPASLPVASPSDITATDDSGMASTSVVLVVTNMDGCVGELVHRYRVVDACGNDAEVQVTYTFLVDTTPPTITCPDSQFQVQVNEFCETFYPAIFPITTDDGCDGDIQVFQDPPAGALIMGPGVYPTTVFAVDACGNTNSCVVPVLVEGDCLHSGIPGKVPEVGIELTKTVYAGHDNGAGCATAGELVDSVIGAPVTYCFTIQNTGDTGLDLIFLEDRDLIPAVLRDVTNFLGMGESISVFEQAIISENLTNTASVIAFPSIGGPQVSDEDTAVVLGGDPAIDIQKTVVRGHNASCPGVELIDGNAGDPVTYCFLVTNTGDVDLQNVRVTDAQIGANIPVGTLTVGQSATVSHNGAVIGPVNTATVTGEASSGVVVNDTDDAHARLGCGCVRGAVFNDLNNDGLVSGENLANVGIEGVLVRIFRVSDGALIGDVRTDSNGMYEFQELVSGQYRVEIDPATVPELLRDSLADALPITVERGICECNDDLDGTSFAGVPAPTAIELEGLQVTPTAEGNLVEWSTAWEQGVLGYNLLGADGQPLNDGLILASGGGAYQFLDAGAQTGSYELQEVTTDLGFESHGSVEVVDAAPSGEPTKVVTAADNRAAFTAAEGIATYLVFEFEEAPVARSGTTAFRGQVLEVDGKFGLYLSVEPGTKVVVE